ncbi:MAG TPA: hypothetical protein VIJ62_00505 [Rhizomicrobium sp.]
MPLVLSHGQGKSGSSFLFQAALLAAETANGMRQKLFGERHFPPGVSVEHYVDTVTDEYAERLLNAIPQGAYYVVKNHGGLSDFVKEKVEAGQILAFTSIRDPRDMAISMMDAGISDHAKGRDNVFTRLTQLSDTLPHLRGGVSSTLQWASCKNVLVTPYYLTATDQNVSLEHLLNHLGLSIHAEKVMQRFAENKAERIWYFHKGHADRFLDDIAPDEIAWLTEELRQEIKQIDALNAQWMAFHGHGALYETLKRSRDDRLARIIAQGD